MGRWGRLRRLGWCERWLLVEALALVPVMAVGLRLLGLRRVQAALARLTPLDRDGWARELAAPSRTHATAEMAGAAARYGPYRARCLRRSLALWWLLRRQGVQSDVRLALGGDGGRWEARAWVELGYATQHATHDVWRRYAAFERAIAVAGAGAKSRGVGLTGSGAWSRE